MYTVEHETFHKASMQAIELPLTASKGAFAFISNHLSYKSLKQNTKSNLDRSKYLI